MFSGTQSGERERVPWSSTLQSSVVSFEKSDQVIETSKAGEGRQETVDRHLHRIQYGLTLCASYNITMVHRFKIHSLTYL